MSSAHQFEFRPPYQLSGESGKAIGPLRQSLESLGVTSLLLDQLSLETDTLRITFEDGTAPEYLQTITCWDADGRRVFTGLCTDPDEQWDGVKTKTVATISGAWWWLSQVQLTSIIADDAGTEQERAIYTFPSQDLATSIRTLLERLEEMGVPLRVGEIDATFQVPQMQFQSGTAESVLTTMLEWLPDASTRVRYDTGGLPRLDVLRRPTAPILTLDLAADNNKAGIPRLKELRSLRPSQVKVQTMEVNATGEIIYGEDVAGERDPATPLGRQILSLSGPGRGEFNSYTPRVATLQTEAVPGAYSSLWTLAKTYDPVIQQAEAENGDVTWAAFGDSGNYPSIPRGITGIGAYRHIAGQMIDFLKTEFAITESETRVSGWIFGRYVTGGPYSDATAYLLTVNRAVAGFSGGIYNQVIYVDFTVPTINNSYPTLTTFVHPEDQALVTPVPDLARNLYNAQNHIPFTGSVPLMPGAPLPLPGTRLNIANGLPKWRHMGAMTRGLSLDLRTGAAEAAVGKSSLNSLSSVINQFARPLSGRIVKA